MYVEFCFEVNENILELDNVDGWTTVNIIKII